MHWAGDTKSKRNLPVTFGEDLRKDFPILRKVPVLALWLFLSCLDFCAFLLTTENKCNFAKVLLLCNITKSVRTSSVVSPICQEGQSERNFPIFAFFFRIFLIFSLFFLIFGNFFAVRSGTLPPFATPVATTLVRTTDLLLLKFLNGKKSLL